MMPRPNGYLVDTNIVVALVRDNALGKYLDHTYGLMAGKYPFHIVVVGVGEARALSLKWNWGSRRRTRLEDVLARFSRIDIGRDPVLDAYAALDAWSAACGNEMGKNDVWVAAIAQVDDLTLLTTDTDFDHLHRAGLIDVEWVDPTSS